MTAVTVSDVTQTVVVTTDDGITVVSAPSPAVTVATTGLGPQGPGGALGMYGSFIDTTDQPLISVSAAQPVTINTTLENRGVTVASNSRITFQIAGTYKILASLQLTNSSNSVSEINFFLKKNGVVVPNSNTRIDLEPRKSISTPYHGCFTVEYQITVANGDYAELYWQAEHLDIAIDTIPAGALHPQSPSVILNVAQVMYTQTASVPRSITVANPIVDDSFTIFRTEVSTTLNRVLALIRGAGASVTFALKAGVDRNAAGTAVTVSEAITNTTTGEEVAVINQPIPAGYYVWLEITAVSGSPAELNVSIEV
jgi:hypothetical protein